MPALLLFLTFCPLLLIHCTHARGSAKVECSSDYCALSEPFIRFPFRLRGRQDEGCGYPGFDLSCNGRNHTIIDLPRLGEFKVEMVDYIKQTLLLTYLDGCLLRRLHEFDALGSILRPSNYTRSITLLNCSNDLGQRPWWKYYATCLSGTNYTVMALPTDQFVEDSDLMPNGCTNWTVVAPTIPNWLDFGVKSIALAWDRPACGSCVERFLTCGLKNEKTLEVTCADVFRAPENSPDRSKWKAIAGVTIPSILVVVGLSFYVRRRAQGNGPQDDNLVLASAADGQLQPQQRAIETRANGLDSPSIASYPTIRLGESSTKLPEPSFNTCAICLLDYHEQDTVKIMPECDHYFHDHCVDQWLKRQATCPLCRKQQHRQQIVS